MKKRHFIAAALLALASLGTQAQKISAMTEAVLRSYEEILQQNPNDYGTLYDRAAKYYQLNRYDDALNDLTRAIAATPAKEKELLAQEYSLYADVCTQLKDYDKALECVNKALELAPESYADYYKKGNLLMHLGRPEEAYGAYSALQRFKSRSQEAYFGMAKACIAMGRNSEAEALIKQAESAAPSSYITYCRIGDLYNDLNSNEGAASNYLSAFLLANDNEVGRPLQSLITLSQRDFPAVNSALNYALGKTTNAVPLHFLQSNLAYESGNYQAAYDAFSQLLQRPEAQAAGVYAQMGRACLALDKKDEAIQNIDAALMQDKSATNFNLKSHAERVNGNPEGALAAAKSAYIADEFDPESLVNTALALMALKRYDEALAPLNEAVMLNPDNAVALLVRGNLQKRHLGNEEQAAADFNRVARNPQDAFPGILYQAMAQYWNGKQLDADSTIANALGASHDKNAVAGAVTYYIETGNLAEMGKYRDSEAAKNRSAHDPAVDWISEMEN